MTRPSVKENLPCSGLYGPCGLKMQNKRKQRDKYSDLTGEHECDGNISRSRCGWNDPLKLGKGIEKVGNQDLSKSFRLLHC